ncbi:MAG: hypothetical protein Q9170_002486 [Blastenia crenularia]
MLNAEQSAEIVNTVLSTCTFPSATELDDYKCVICHEDSLGIDGTEKATKLSCGHVLGMSCLVTWTLKKVKDGSRALHCPFCSRCFLTTPLALSRRESERQDLEKWIAFLAQWSPGGEPRNFEVEMIGNIRQAEELWNRLCNAVLESLELELTRSERGLRWRIEELICGAGVLVEQLLSFGNVYNFYVAYTYQNYEPDVDTHQFLPHFWEPYHELVAHLRTMGEPHMIWRVYQAFQSPPGQLAEYRLRLEHCRLLLSSQIEEARATLRQ